jgi:23S rRNA (guanosine2251-2'-O)-methyltransferase
MDFLYIEGKRSVEEAIKSDTNINYIMIAEGMHLGNIISLAKEKNIRLKTVSKTKLDYTSKTQKHQGVIAVVSSFQYSDTDNMIKSAENKNEKPFLVIADSISDPHNLGAIIRSAECFNAHGIIIPKHRAAEVNETVYRSSAGAVSHIPIAQVTNISSEIDNLKKQGLWIVCADMDGQDLNNFDFNMPLALVLGAEGKGVGRLIKEKCDFIVKIPIKGNVASLNVSVAAGIIMHAISRTR